VSGVYPQSFFGHFRNRVLADSALITVTRPEPISEFLCAFAQVARCATSGDILTSDDACVVDNVFPGCHSFSGAAAGQLKREKQKGRTSRPLQ